MHFPDDAQVFLVLRALLQLLLGELRVQLGQAGAQNLWDAGWRIGVRRIARLKLPGPLHLSRIDVGEGYGP